MRRAPVPCTIWRRSFSTHPPKQEPLSLAFQRHDGPSSTSSTAAPLIIMHGLFGSQRNNRTMSKALARDLNRAVYTIDLRNHGESPHTAVHTYTSMATDVEAFISTHSIPPSILIGHSMGAKVAMTLALRRPQHYAGLVPVDNSPVDAALKSDFTTYVTAMKEIADQTQIQKQSEADAVLAKYEKDVNIRQFLLTNFVRDPDTKRHKFRIPLNTLAKSMPDLADFPFRDPDRARYEGPTLVVRGTKGHYVPDEALPLIGRFFPKFELLSFDCGHWVMSEKFDEFRNGLVEWVGRCVDGEK